MPKFTVNFERAAYEVKTIVVEADDEQEAERFATEELERQGPNADPAILSHTNECYPDTESMWEHTDTEEAP
jgi:hypothetical protein